MLHLVVPLWNQWEMTEAFLRSLEGAEPRDRYRLILVDNGSTDATARGLRAWKGRVDFKLIRNRRNLGVAKAWNQGVRAALKEKAVWIGVLNNDLLLAAGSLCRLAARAEERGWSLASPATREGVLGYDFSRYALDYMRRCYRWDREGLWFGWCFLVRREVFDGIGLFDEGFEVGIGEDEDFFRRAVGAGFRCGVTGAAFVHHFGSATLGPWRKLNGKEFEERNLARLRGRYAVRRESALLRLARRCLSIAGRVRDVLRWGHQLKEKA